MRTIALAILIAAFPSMAGNNIVRLSLRDYSVTIASDVGGPLYTVEDKNGNLLAQNLTPSELKASNPELYETLIPSLATTDLIDASIDRRYLPSGGSHRKTAAPIRDWAGLE